MTLKEKLNQMLKESQPLEVLAFLQKQKEYFENKVRRSSSIYEGLDASNDLLDIKQMVKLLKKEIK